VQHTRDRLVEQVEVVADDEQRAPVVAQEAEQPLLRVDVEVVRRLVEQERVAAREQDPRQLDTSALATGEDAERQVERSALSPSPAAMLRASLSAAYPPLDANSSSARLKRATLRSLGSSSIDRRSFSIRTSASSMPRPDRTWVIAVRPSRTPAMRGSCGRYPNPPLRMTRPSVGSTSPPSTLNRLVFPAPLRPTSPTLSRATTVKLAWSTTSRPPTSTERSRTCNTAVQRVARGLDMQHARHADPSGRATA
jgi:hypothetical protein